MHPFRGPVVRAREAERAMGKKILLADDSITIQKVIELTFSDEDFDVVTVGNGRLALEKVQEVRPDIVLCDIIMPEKDGYEVCEFVKKTPALQHIPVLLLTGAFEPFDQDRAARVGSDGFLAKPFEPETLIAKVKELLGRAASRAASAPPPPRPSTGTPTVAIPFVPPARESDPSAPRAGFPTTPPLTVVPPRPPEPIPFPRAAAPAPEPLKASPSPLDAPAPSAVRFIPEEPFEDFEAGSFGADEEAATPARGAEPIPFRSASDELLPMTPEESESLSVPDSASTVMFKADAVQWQVPPVPAPAPPVPVAPAAPTPSVPAAPVAASPAPSAPTVESEPTVFEEVIEEDLEFGQAYVPPPAAPAAPERPALEPDTQSLNREKAAQWIAAPPPSNPRPAPSGPPSKPPVSAPAASKPPMPSAPPPAPPPVVAPPAAAASFAPHPEPSSPPSAPQTAAVPSPWASGRPVAPAWQPVPVSEPPSPAPAAPPAAAPVSESFADLAAEVPSAEPAKAASQAAEVPVPVDTVEKIAQRVVAQISEKVVREIAWDVIPDLAEALIKAEIERLKAELQRI